MKAQNKHQKQTRADQLPTLFNVKARDQHVSPSVRRDDARWGKD
ncbi:MAG: hypothetical protein ABSC91_00615 [Candidatus Bathyarchaeia archaeon]